MILSQMRSYVVQDWRFSAACLSGDQVERKGLWLLQSFAAVWSLASVLISRNQSFFMCHEMLMEPRTVCGCWQGHRSVTKIYY